jgi:hypothetical protein
MQGELSMPCQLPAELESRPLNVLVGPKPGAKRLPPPLAQDVRCQLPQSLAFELVRKRAGRNGENATRHPEFTCQIALNCDLTGLRAIEDSHGTSLQPSQESGCSQTVEEKP